VSSIRDTVVALKELQHRPEYSGGIRDKGLPPRVFVRSGLAIVSMTALHHANTPVVVPGPSSACAARVRRGVVDKELRHRGRNNITHQS